MTPHDAVVHAPAKGYGHALRKGIEEARGQFIVMGDADDSYDFSQVPRFVAQWREGYEVMMGNRFKGEIKPSAHARRSTSARPWPPRPS